MARPVSINDAHDPALIPGIYNECDQWCMYCHATAWCLAFRYTPVEREGGLERDLTERLAEGVLLLKRLWQAEQRSTAPIDRLVSVDPLNRIELHVANDPLVRMAEQYMQLSSDYLRSRPDFPFEMKRRAQGPTAFEVFAWYHALVPAKVYRALYSAARAARGDATLNRDAQASAKVALIGMDRSLDAIATLTAEDADSRLRRMDACVRELRGELERRFPDARAFVRAGLD